MQRYEGKAQICKAESVRTGVKSPNTARDGQSYRNRTGIGQWEDALGSGFLRVHRAFLVNVSDMVMTAPDAVSVGGQSIPVSRKYRDSVKSLLRPNEFGTVAGKQ